MKKTILIFSLLILSIILLFQTSKFAFIKGDINAEVLIALIAIVFFFAGVVFNKKSFQKETTEQKEVIDFKKVKELKISNREYEVLLALAEDLTNKEIAAKLFISESTTKTHVSKILSKLEASRRGEAVKKAQMLHII